MLRIAAIVVAVTASIAAGYWLLRPAPVAAPPQLKVSAALGGDARGYAQVLAPRPFVFPADYGPHPAYRTEWWYFTGNLHTPAGRRFGYELTIFRIALAPRPPASPSAWATNQLYMAHFAMSDPDDGRFDYFQRLERGALRLAGARAVPFRVWIDNWSIATAGRRAGFPWRLHARAKGVAVDFKLRGLKPIVAQGDHGFSRKSAGRGHASYYYSIPRLATRGTLNIGGRNYQVAGLSWLDREWSSSALAPNQAGWDWFALQLNNGVDLMFYRLRKKNGATGPMSAGSLITAGGRKIALSDRSVKLKPREWWTSPRGGRYPIAWTLAVPRQRCQLRISPLMKDQELVTFVRYWEGAVKVSGRCRGDTVSGHGYLELTGYAH
jgi:predicted secreted hydrolase